MFICFLRRHMNGKQTSGEHEAARATDVRLERVVTLERSLDLLRRHANSQRKMADLRQRHAADARNILRHSTVATLKDELVAATRCECSFDF